MASDQVNEEIGYFVYSRYFVHLLNLSYKTSNHHTLSNFHITALHQKSLNEMKEMIKTETVGSCITTDCWTSRSNMGYIAITFHFIDNNFGLRSVLYNKYLC
ncbi:zinc finger BED domain-containing protein 4-like [Aphis craccivora]|uniref:Zinc finger BED domain-containing protein 4-like n=1 Tax=Aphis craccivora TaxID=307492 RepID=A0A6G0W1U3_APHCR|nr:zinc finger BED domain-containing protein 4-like [Aphis craccivora]